MYTFTLIIVSDLDIFQYCSFTQKLRISILHLNILYIPFIIIALDFIAWYNIRRRLRI